MKIVLTLDPAKNSFIVAEGRAGVEVKSRCANSSYPNLILVDVPENALDPELVASLRQRIDDLEKDINADSDALLSLAAQFKEVRDERDALKAELAKLTDEQPETQPEDVITTQNEGKSKKGKG
jgi:septal ring factor EnvC (AmiA/AmiB activator)